MLPDVTAIQSSIETGGTSFSSSSAPIIAQRAPTTSDIGYSFGQNWIDQPNNDVYELTSITANSAYWTVLGASSSSIADVARGGTGVATLTAHGVMIGEGTSPIAVTSAGASGQPLLSGGASADPAFGDLSVSHGGTGATTLTGVLTGNGTSAVSASAVTQHGVVLGAAANAVSSLSVAATGTVLAGATGADPVFTATPALTSVAIGAGGLTITSGTGAPGGTAPKGSLYLRTDGSGVNDRAYINTSGTTTWTAIVTVA